ncbi:MULTISPECIES: phosphatase PAP2 family protein [Paenibacillus]|uniref:Phosphatase PAP2 family protein n=1 Tax=Paenibacillus xylanilyticus TaxID=248903 RepID=A0A7Y6BV84_9BACL|nr:phosphatase PAP2 family protein [Paenibacillus xylanilyticus]NUU75539.1 phosphatase PAP2 family protein [Paenibacillus xylanilyticus]
MLRESNSSFFGSSPRLSWRSLFVWSGVGVLFSSALVILLAVVGAWLGTHFIIQLDDQIQHWFYLHSESRLALLPVISFITAIGSFKISALAAICAAALFFIQRSPRSFIYGYVILGSFAVMWLLNTGLKEIFRRSRPELDHLMVVHGYSFPSGHAMISMGFYGMFFVIWAIERQRRSASIILPIVCGIGFIGLIGISRIMLGVHYPTDVFAGFVAGLAWLVCMMGAMKRMI